MGRCAGNHFDLPDAGAIFEVALFESLSAPIHVFPGFFVLVLVLSDSGTRARWGIFEDDRSQNSGTSKGAMADKLRKDREVARQGPVENRRDPQGRSEASGESADYSRQSAFPCKKMRENTQTAASSHIAKKPRIRCDKPGFFRKNCE
jgi:hypothetical protein